MRPATKEYDVKGTGFQGQRAELRLDPRATKHFMGMFTDMYEDRELAVIRELSTNARDSHVEAGVGHQPIEVTTPSEWDPSFSVQDHGLGLSAEDVTEIYSMYGASTKRESDDVVGMLGIGAKSPLTLSPQFTIIGVKDRRRITVVVSREEDGGGAMTIVSDEPSDDENMVRVSVPITGAHGFREKCRRFFRFWEPGTVLVDGGPPERVEGLQITDTILLAENPDADNNPGRYGGRYSIPGEAYVVMGNVPYPTDHQFFDVPDGRVLVMYVPIGDVLFAPSREGLMDAPQTERTLERLKQEIQEGLGAAMQREVEGAATNREALAEALRAEKLLPGSYKVPFEDLRWQGEALPTGYKGVEGDRLVKFTGKYYYAHTDYDRPGSRSYTPLKDSDDAFGDTWPVNRWPRTLWVEGYDRDTYTDTQRKKLDLWVDDNLDEQPVAYFLLKGEAPRDWLDPTMVVKWDDVWALSLTQTVQGDGPVASGLRAAGTYPVWSGEATHSRPEISPAELVDVKPLLYVTDALTPTQADKIAYGYSRSYSGYRGRLSEKKYAEWMVEYYGAGTARLIAIPNTREAKLNELLPHAENVKDVIEREWTKWWDGLSEDQRTALALHQPQPSYYNDTCDREQVAKLDGQRLDDPDIAELVRVAQIDTRPLVSKLRAFEQVRSCNVKRPGLNGHLDGYPILTLEAIAKHPEDAALYINAAYAARK